MYCEHREETIRQAFKGFKKKGQLKTAFSRSDRVGSLTTTGRLIKRGFSYRVLTGKLLLFWIGRRSW